MKLISKDAISRFSGQQYTMQSMMEVFGHKPQHLSDYIRMKARYKKDQWGFMYITEGLGNIYDDPDSKKIQGLDTYAFTWNIDVANLPTIRITRNCTDTGVNHSTITMYLADRYYSKGDYFALENRQQLFVTDEPTRISDTEYRYTLKLITNSPSEEVDTRYTLQNMTTRFISNAQPEISDRGSIKQHYNTEMHINHMSKIRVGQKWSAEFAARKDQYFMSDEDFKKASNGHKFRIFKFSSIEQAVLDQFMQNANNFMIFGRSTIDPKTQRSTLQDALNQDIIIGDGIIAQYERYAYYINYDGDTLGVGDFQDAIENIREKRGQSMGNHITCICNRRFSSQKATALQDAIGTMVPSNNGTWFFTKEDIKMKDPHTNRMRKTNKVKVPNEVTVGATFMTYVYEGNTITFVIDEALTDQYPDQGFAIFIDTGIYEEENGNTPAVSLKTLKGRSLIKGHVEGFGGKSGTSNGTFSTATEASSYDVLGWRGVQVKNPYAATIMMENKY